MSERGEDRGKYRENKWKKLIRRNNGRVNREEKAKKLSEREWVEEVEEAKWT